MFRKPRENASAPASTAQSQIKPSTGRAPTPPGERRSSTVNPQPRPEIQQKLAMPAKGAPASAKKKVAPLTPRATSKGNVTKTPTLGRQGSKIVPKGRSKGNTKITSFFKKAEVPKTEDDDALFLGGGGGSAVADDAADESDIDSLFGDLLPEKVDEGEEERYNELGGPVKRRKLSPEPADGACEGAIGETSAAGPAPVRSEKGECSPPPPAPVPATNGVQKKRVMSGPFMEDSDSDDEEFRQALKASELSRKNHALQGAAVAAERREVWDEVHEKPGGLNQVVNTAPVDQQNIKENRPVIPSIYSVQNLNKSESQDVNYSKAPVPALKNEETSYGDLDFEDLEEFPDDDEFQDGEEFVERKWMEEQALLEAAETPLEDQDEIDEHMGQATPFCPICESSLESLSADDATRHVNACLDGNPIPIPSPVKKEMKMERPDTTASKLMPTNASSRFSRAAIARPGQANPFSLDDPDKAPSSAFNKLMSSKVEDAAWASAAAAENASRGKPAYKRTCPFYKIMPGLYICVDAFRYGAVEGCKAYFLSHFHSDHYIGLTGKWCHGPIYCSKVTANLVRQQLKVDALWVKPLEFEERVEVPGTQGVSVTMIPANHCPGSSLFLFEKIVGKGQNPKVQRILHCGDFRACPAHIAHPLLMPNIVDSITGITKQQKIDVCYLDTTYLNPKYAFPPQEDVVQACADMCVSLSKHRADESDNWEQAKRERAGKGMTKFVEQAKLKSEDNSLAMSLSSKDDKSRGRLLVVCGTYSIGKERICMGIARALDCKVYAPPAKMRIIKALEDPELMSRMTDDPRAAQIHMQMIMEIRAETLQDYLNGFKPHFDRVVGFRPSGWNYKPPGSRFTESPQVQTVLQSPTWRSHYSLQDLTPQRGSTREASCFGVPYSEHSSFRELTMFVCALRIEKVVPTVNVGSAPGRAKMKSWIDRWMAERKKSKDGVVKIGVGKEGGQVEW